MHKLTFFTKAECGLCDAAWFIIEKVRAEIPFESEKVDITAEGNEHWLAAYQHHIPVVHLDGREVFRHRVDERALRALLGGKETGLTGDPDRWSEAG